MEVTTRDGRRLVESAPVARGDPGAPLSAADLQAKFLDNARGVLGSAAEQVIANVEQIEQLPSCEPLLALLRVA